jgi:uncharacterized membrane protein YjjB (DUF3815 family)
VAFTVLLRAKPRDARWVLLSVVIALAISRSVGAWIGAELAAFTSALAVASVSHAFARWMDRPIALMLTPGILFLVPGSIGFLSLRSLLDDDIEGGVTTAFRMALVAMALAAGVLVATAAIPPRKAL